jgi:2,3-bisphosphoglycerate-dependent phosphoglycerate mutase
VTERATPTRLVLVRHAESVGNLARDLAESNGEQLIDIATRDMDVPLSPTGEEQAALLGTWFADHESDPFTVVYSSPYLRAAETARIACEHAGNATEVALDERLREREFGVLDRLTRAGIEARFPEEAEARARVGKFYYRPPGGESWCDVALRVRSILDTMGREHPGERVLVVAHEVVIYVFRYVLERLGEAELLELNRENELANCSVTTYHSPGDALELLAFDVRPERVPETVEPDIPRAPR